MSGAAGQRGSGAVAAVWVALLQLVLAHGAMAQAQSKVLDDFESPLAWVAAPADGVLLTIHPDSGRTGRAMRLDFDFQGHGGYAVTRKAIPLDLPYNYAFTFWIRGEAPVNNLEFKLVDSTGDNVWWRNQRSFPFSTEWKKVTIRKRQIEFAWGPKGGGEPDDIRSIELAITAGSGGRGRVWIDDFRLEPRPPDQPYDLTPTVTASSEKPEHPAGLALDADSTTFWTSDRAESTEWIEVDFLKIREFGGLTIDWTANGQPESYSVEFSADKADWTKRLVRGSNGGRDYIALPEAEGRYLRIQMARRAGQIGMSDLHVQPLAWGATPNAFFHAVAADAPRGRFPRYFEDVQTYWTMVGSNGDGRRSLLGEDGAFEPFAGGFSVEPFIWMGDELLSWSGMTSAPSLGEGYLPIPTVERQGDGLSLKVTAFSSGTGDSAAAHTWYRLRNTGSVSRKGMLLLAIRPLQVNPPWQFLGVAGGVSTITSLRWSDGVFLVNDSLRVIPSLPPVATGVTSFDSGDISEFLGQGGLPQYLEIRDSAGYASGALAYRFELAPNAVTDVFLRFPLSPASPDTTWLRDPAGPLTRSMAEWKSSLGRVTVDLPPPAQAVEDALKSTLAYMLINRDGAAIEPGARSYRRSWIRDGAMIGAAFLRLGHPEPVRQFIEWYAPYQYDSGKVPCCVDARGSDPVPEHDSHGELIHIIAEYYRYTGDRGFLGRMWPHVAAAARYIDSMRSTRRTAEYSRGSNRRFYGLMPPSISHEGYSAKPVHSYWDDFWVLRGLIDAAEMAGVLGKTAERDSLVRLRDQFRHDLHQSIQRTIQESGIDYIPGSADLADFDATSTSIGLEPGGQLDSLPADVLRHTFERYLREVRARRDSTGWEAYTPYEWRNVGALVRLGKLAEAAELFDILFEGRRPAAWNQWPEVVHRDSLAPKFLGDLPHTWVGSDFARSLLDMIAYVRPADSTLVIGAGIPPVWVGGPGITVRDLPIGRGKLNIRMTTDGVRLDGTVEVPPGGILVYRPGHGAEFKQVNRLPADVIWNR